MIEGICTLDDFDLKSKTVLCRIDINSPLQPCKTKLMDITRIERCLPTITELSEKRAKIVLLAHQGSDIEYNNFGSTKPHAHVMETLLGQEVKFIDDVCGPTARANIAALKEGEILLLDNVRYMAEEMTLFENMLKLTPEEQSQTLLVKNLAPLADLFVCDAFAAAHRSQPTLIGFPEILPSCMGRLFEEEYSSLIRLREDPAKPCLFILGGAKVQDAFLIIDYVLKNNVADYILTGGVVANIMLLADGKDLGEGTRDFVCKHNLEAFIEHSRDLLNRYRPKIHLPKDLVIVAADSTRQEYPIGDLPIDGSVTDIGLQTISQYTELINQAQTIFINGPMGVFENRSSSYGTKKIWVHAAKSKAFTVVGGGDSISAARKFGVLGSFSYVSTAGGGLIRFLSGEELPAITALRKAAQRFPSDRSQILSSILNPDQGGDKHGRKQHGIENRYSRTQVV